MQLAAIDRRMSVELERVLLRSEWMPIFVGWRRWVDRRVLLCSELVPTSAWRRSIGRSASGHWRVLRMGTNHRGRLSPTKKSRSLRSNIDREVRDVADADQERVPR